MKSFSYECIHTHLQQKVPSIVCVWASGSFECRWDKHWSLATFKTGFEDSPNPTYTQKVQPSCFSFLSLSYRNSVFSLYHPPTTTPTPPCSPWCVSFSLLLYFVPSLLCLPVFASFSSLLVVLVALLSGGLVSAVITCIFALCHPCQLAVVSSAAAHHTFSF